jgi:uncharacterized protein (DUF427 family)
MNIVQYVDYTTQINRRTFMNEKSITQLTDRESVWDYPRPPAIEDVPERIKIIFNDEIIVDSKNTKRVLETSHPPTYYIPSKDIKPESLQHTPDRSWCEWKGEARYFDVVIGNQTAEKAAWFYPNPTPGFTEIKDHVAFYASKMDVCFVGNERVKPQPGGFYGGWITSKLNGPFKSSGW